MTADLRTRIAAVLTEAYPGKLASVAEFAADAVIRELGLQRLEAGKWADGLSSHRYITDWIKNE